LKRVLRNVLQLMREHPEVLAHIAAAVIFAGSIALAFMALMWAFISVGPWSIVALTCTLVLSTAVVWRDARAPGGKQ